MVQGGGLGFGSGTRIELLAVAVRGGEHEGVPALSKLRDRLGHERVDPALSVGDLSDLAGLSQEVERCVVAAGAQHRYDLPEGFVSLAQDLVHLHPVDLRLGEEDVVVSAGADRGELLSASSAEFVGALRLRELSKCLI